MEDPPLGPDGDAERRPGSRSGTPLWVKLFGLITLIVALALVVVLLVSGGDHGPGRHAIGGNVARLGIAADQPAGGAGRVGPAPPARGPVPE